MLQQTRVAAVIPYYERFLKRFPDACERLAAGVRKTKCWRCGAASATIRAPEICKRPPGRLSTLASFPRTHESIRELAGVGDYTAAAVASIAFGLPHAAVDGNVRRVVVRLAGDPSADVGEIAVQLMSRRDPGRWNQAMMELGATVCVPREPLCAGCPLASSCVAKQRGIQRDLPPRKKKVMVRREHTLLVIRRRGRILLTPSPRVSGFWELPEALSGVRLGAILGTFRHAITNSQYYFEVREARITTRPRTCKWWDERDLGNIPLSTASKKALDTPRRLPHRSICNRGL